VQLRDFRLLVGFDSVHDPSTPRGKAFGRSQSKAELDTVPDPE
jgi:hypothetical protein